MRHLLGFLLVLAVGCGKADAPQSGGSAPPPPPTAGSSGPTKSGPIDPATTGAITGVVKLDGWLKPDAKVGLTGVAYCNAQHPNGPPLGDTLVMGEGQTMANVFVAVTNIRNRRFETPSTPVVLDQVGCIYKPHVVAIQVNQPLIVRNSDSVLHNVNAKPLLNESVNKGQPTKGQEDRLTFSNPEERIFLKCDVHPWMGAWLHVVAHPFFDLTEKDGTYTIAGLPEGEYEIRAWHERFQKEPLVAMVKVEATKTATQDFTFKGGPKPAGK